MKATDNTTNVAGIDVAKMHLDVVLHGHTQARRFDNNASGFEALSAWLRRHGVGRVGLEASGGYERAVSRALAEAGFGVVRHQPLEVRLLARFKRIRAKNDRIDAALIAAATAQTDTLKAAADPVLLDLAEWMTAYEQVADQLAQLKTCLEHVTLDELRAHYEALIASSRRVKAALAKEILARIRADPALAQRYDLLRSLPGIGPINAAVLVVRMPELGRLERGQAASLIGVAPFDRDSGQYRGQRKIFGGRDRPRRFLYLAALAAKRCDPGFKAFADRLLAEGKRPKVAIVAVMRKLIEAANLVLKRKSPWAETPPAIPKHE